MSANATMLRTESLAIGYGKARIGTDLHLDIGRGEMLCLLGPNGCGKTTLFKTLLGLIPSLAGEVEVLGQVVRAWPRHVFAQHVGYVPQAHESLFAFTVEEVVLMGRAARLGPFSVPSKHDRDVANACIDALGITHLAGRVYTAISGGERQLALTARALAQEPALLVMDEPTASLDFGNQIRVLEHIAGLRDKGIAILMSTHQPEHALRCADRIALLEQGRITAIGPAAATATASNLSRLYGVPEPAVTAMLRG